MQFTDSVAIADTRMTRGGYMVIDARIARTGIQVYSGAEMGRPAMDAVRVYRPDEEVFSDRAMASFAHRPVTDDHPSQMVSAANWRDHSVGMTGDIVTRDGDHVRVPFTLMDAATIATVQAGKRELSAGYTAEINFTSGQTPGGEAYDAVMTNIDGNHLAIVSRGRAGASCRIGDSWTAPSQPKEPAPMAELNRSVVVDGVTYSMSDQGAQLIEKLTRDLGDAASKLTSKDGQIAALNSAHQAAIGTKDAEMATVKATIEAKDGEIAALKARVTDTTALDAMIVAREATIVGARRILGDTFDPKGKPDADIRRAAVVKKLGDALVNGKSDDYVAAAFDTLTVTTASRDPVRDAILRPGRPQVDVTDAAAVAHAEMTSRLANGWQSQKGAV